jgi:hypothetical protein
MTNAMEELKLNFILIDLNLNRHRLATIEDSTVLKLARQDREQVGRVGSQKILGRKR